MIAVGALQFFILFVALVRSKALAVMVGPEGVGVIGLIDQIVVTMAQFGALGLPFAAMKFMSAAHAKSEESYRDSFAAFARILLVLASVITAVGFVVVLVAAPATGELAQYQGTLFMSILVVPVTMLTILISHALASAERPRSAAIYNLSFATAGTVAALVGLTIAGITGFYVGAFVAGAGIICGALVYMHRALGLNIWRQAVSLRQEFRQLSLILHTSMAAYVNLVSAAAMLLFMRYAILQNGGAELVGLLQSDFSIALSAGSVLATLSALYFAPSINRGDQSSVKFRKAENFNAICAFFIVLGMVPVALFPGLVLTILFTKAFAAAAIALIPCLIWQMLQQVATTYSHVLIGIDRPISVIVATVVSVVAGVGSVFFLTHHWGILLAPIALIVSVLVRLAIMVALLVWREQMDFPWGTVWRYLVVTAAIIAAPILFEPTVVVPSLDGLLGRTAFALVAIALAWSILRLSPRPS
jgi:polysaccharide transporter, PST family